MLNTFLYVFLRKLFRSSAHFSIVYSFVLSYMSSLYILDITPYRELSFTDVFSHSIGCLFVLLMASFTVWKLFSLM